MRNFIANFFRALFGLAVWLVCTGVIVTLAIVAAGLISGWLGLNEIGTVCMYVGFLITSIAVATFTI